MRFSNFLIKTNKNVSKEAKLISHKYLIKGGFIKMYNSGIYALLPLAKKSLVKIENIIREEMNEIGGLEISLPCLSSKEIWQESGRYQNIGNDMFRLKDRKGKDMLLNMTHEELIVQISKTEFSSYKDLPKMLYQFQIKFRDEIRPRGGLIRLREFMMKDAYSFHESENCLKNFYEIVKKKYQIIFKRCGLKNFLTVCSDNGIFGGNYSHEFQLISLSGEDTILVCQSCGYTKNSESEILENCPDCGSHLNKQRGIEIGNIFHLGDKYSKSMKSYFVNDSGNKVPHIMGCYGIGVTRLLPAIIEENHDQKGIKFPITVSPFDLHICVLRYKDPDIKNISDNIYNNFKDLGIDVIMDDSEDNPGTKFANSDLIGIPFRMVISPKNIKNSKIEFVERNDLDNPKEINLSEAVDHISKKIFTEYKSMRFN